jgi:hypothetical protein
MEASKEKDIELEVEVNAALEKECERVEEEVLSSQHTEFVEDTQYCSNVERHETDVHSEANLNVTLLEKETLLEMEKKNKEFIEMSWTNIVEDEESEQRLLKQLEEDHQDDFQVVNRSRGKPIKKKSPSRI